MASLGMYILIQSCLDYLLHVTGFAAAQSPAKRVQLDRRTCAPSFDTPEPVSSCPTALSLLASLLRVCVLRLNRQLPCHPHLSSDLNRLRVPSRAQRSAFDTPPSASTKRPRQGWGAMASREAPFVTRSPRLDGSPISPSFPSSQPRPRSSSPGVFSAPPMPEGDRGDSEEESKEWREDTRLMFVAEEETREGAELLLPAHAQLGALIFVVTASVVQVVASKAVLNSVQSR